jgi:hypothetical protein
VADLKSSLDASQYETNEQIKARVATAKAPVMCAVMGDLRVSLSCTSCLRGRLCTGLGDIAGLFACAAG